MHVIIKPENSKLLCEFHGMQVKIEVNQTKRGIVGGDLLRMPVCDRVQEEFGLYCEADIVPLTLLYGGKIAAALSRQHPRDMFDVKYMEYPFENTREGLLFCLLSGDRPIHESFAPRMIDQHDALERQFAGMTEMPFTYEDFAQTRARLVNDVNSLMTLQDKRFLICFESAEPDWDNFEFSYFRDFPSVKWKLLNLCRLKKQNSGKLAAEVQKLRNIFSL